MSLFIREAEPLASNLSPYSPPQSQERVGMIDLRERLSEGSVGIVSCIDEHIAYGEKVVVFGLAGSLITPAGYKNGNLSRENQDLIERYRRSVFNALEQVAGEMGIEDLGVTSHVGCGWRRHVGIEDDEQGAQLTEAMARELGWQFFGQIAVAREPRWLNGRREIAACITRPEESHVHTAGGVIVTVGGGITQAEIRRLSKEWGYGDSFVISFDWPARAIKAGLLSDEEAQALLALQVKLADRIAERVSAGSSVRLFTARRLGREEVDTNWRLAGEVLAGFVVEEIVTKVAPEWATRR